MPRNNKRKSNGNRHRQRTRPQALQRPLLGIDQKHFVLNDVVPLILPDPQNSTTYTCVINADVNGYTWNVQDSTFTSVATGSQVYGATTGQFGVQALMYTQYYIQSVQLDVTLSQGGSTYSMSPLVQFQNPNGITPFIIGTGGFASLISAPQSTVIHQPYSKHVQHVDYQRWLMAMTDRCWRKTIAPGSLTRELYPSDGLAAEDFVVPSLTTSFQFTVPQNTFATGSGNFVFGLFKTQAHYVFSQRRTDIQDIVNTERQRVASTPRTMTFPQVNPKVQ